MKNKKQFTRKDFTKPEEISLVCPACDKEVSTCNICGQGFEAGYVIACRDSKEHICGRCYNMLPEGL
jgi:hypothetical protein